MPKQFFRIVGIFDTETCNIELNGKHTAYPVCWIANDLRNIDIPHYEPNSPQERVTIFRREADFIAWIETLISWGLEVGVIPIISAYNLMFDMQTILEELASRYSMDAIAQSSTNAYTIDLKIDDDIVLRFWDTFHLEMNGLAAMGRTCGFAKAVGEWDYTLIRTPETELTKEEINYAKRDVQVIPAYLRWLCEANEWLKPDMLGVTVITKTSLLRQFAKSQFKKRRVTTSKGASYSLFQLFRQLADSEVAEDYFSYALRRACFRGGFTFTGAKHAAQIQYNVHSLDVVSMHHTFINGRRIPVRFEVASVDELTHAINYVLKRSIDDVLRRYDYPFYYAFHAKITFFNLRLKKDSAFAEHHIALLASSKLDAPNSSSYYEQSELTLDVDKGAFNYNFRDSGVNAECAFSKIYAGERVSVHVSELELWCMSRVYEWDSFKVEYGELSTKTTKIPDYVTLQSNLLFERKNSFKEITKHYQEGTPYIGELTSVIPAGIAEGLRTGKLTNSFIESYYQSTVKGQFNSIYGSMCMAEVRPEFMFNDIGELLINPETRITHENYNEKLPQHSKVLYTYGLRIVGGSRMHMIIALELLHAKFGGEIKVLGGDTDSMKISTPQNITPEMLIKALKPLHNASDMAIKNAQARVRKLNSDISSKFDGVGHFEFESTSSIHFEAWNKGRISIINGKTHITCAGLSRPENSYTIEHWADELVKKYRPEDVLPWILSYNTTIHYDICHFLAHTQPRPNKRVMRAITDYRGQTTKINEHEAIALYPQHRIIGSELARVNWQNICYLRKIGIEPETREHLITLINGKAALYVDDAGELKRLY